MIDEQWNNTLHCPIYAAGIYLSPTFSYSCGFIFDVELMDELFTYVQNMVSSLVKHAKISKEMEIYRMTGGKFSFDMDIHDRTTKMSSKL